MKNFFKNQKGINLISLSIAVIILLVLTNVVLYNVKSNLGVEKLKAMQSDIETLRDKISYFYSQNGTIPANTNIEYTNISNIQNAGVISTAVDTGNFYVIDLSALENLTLNYGEDYKKIQSGEATTEEQINALQDLYIINEDSHNIFFVRGIKFDNEWFYTDYTSADIDKKAVNLITIDTTKESWSPVYDKTASYKDENGDIATIPEGFQVSRKQGEDTVDNGLVVLGPDKSEFVWVPVNDINNMAQCETAGGDCNLELDENDHLKCTNEAHSATAEKIVGKLYATDVGENFGTVNTSYSADTGLREPDVVKDYDNNTSYNNGLFTSDSLKSEYKAMAESVAKNGGFYIGRYETSLSSATESSAGTSGTVQSKAGVIPTSTENSATNMWYGLYQAQKGLSNEYYTSSMIWGSQYDAMLNWVKNGTGADKSKVTTTNIGGNYSGSVATTGNNSYSNDSINNIRDLGGNLYEWTLEVDDYYFRVLRGGSFNYSYSPSRRDIDYLSGTFPHDGSRLTLYIK